MKKVAMPSVQKNKERGTWNAFIQLTRVAPELRQMMVPYLALFIASKLAAAWAGAMVAVAMGGTGWASDVLGAGAGLAVWFGIGRLLEMLVDLGRDIMFAGVSTAAEEALSAPAFMAALMAPPGSEHSATETAKRVENQSARMFLSFMLNHMGGAVGDLLFMTAMAVSIGAGTYFLWALPATVGVVSMGWFTQGLNKKIWGTYDETGAYAKILSRSGELLTKAGLSKAYGSESVYMSLRTQASELARAELTAYRGRDVWLIHAAPALAALSMAALFALGAHGMDGSVAAGAAFGAAVAALGAAFARAQQMGYAFESITVNLIDVNKSLDAVGLARAAMSSGCAATGATGPKAGPGTLRLKNLVARRQGMDRPAARVDTLTVVSGEVLWIVGSSGAGKSTLLGAATATLPHDEGEVLWSAEPASSWSELCAWVPQASVPAPGSLAWNLRLGNADASDAVLWDALSEVGMRVRVEAAGGLGAELSLIGLSGGEAQRISIARALVSGRPLVALDEPTSALDALNDALVVAAIRALARRGAVVLVTSHRLASIPPGARVLCMDQGVVAEEGRLEQLIAGSGAVSKLWAAALRSEDENG